MAMRIPWLTPETEEKKDQEIELKPSDVKLKLDKIDAMESKVAQIDDIKKGVDTVTTYIAQQKADREAAIQEQQRRAEVAREAEENKNAPTFENDPEGALNHQLSPILKQNYLLTAKQDIRDKIESGDFEFYSGAVKDEVDRLIEGQTTGRGQAVSAEYLENAYAIALHKNRKAIEDGKIKSRFSAVSGSSTGTGAPSTEEDKSKRALTDEEKKYAAAFGLDEKEYNKYRETEYV